MARLQRVAAAGVGGDGGDSGPGPDPCPPLSPGKDDHDVRADERNSPPVHEIQSRDVCHPGHYQGKV